MERKYNLIFTKAVASGNDFIVIDNKSGELDSRMLDYSHLARELCPRRHAVGADGVLVLESSDAADFRMRIINPDGSEVTMCGNGARCSALYASSARWGDNLTIETGAGILKSEVSGGNVKLKMSDPKDLQMNINLGIGPNMMTVHFVDTGVPHVVHLVEDLENYPVKDIGSKIRHHPMFEPEGTNANFVGDIAEGGASLRTYERGVEDETLACGTGTTASAIILALLGEAEPPVVMKTKSGEDLTVHFNMSGKKIDDVYLEGSAQLVYEAKI